MNLPTPPKRLWQLYEHVFRVFADQSFYYDRLNRLVRYHQLRDDRLKSIFTWAQVILVALLIRIAITFAFTCPLDLKARILLFDTITMFGFPFTYQIIMFILLSSIAYLFVQLYPLHYSPAYLSILWTADEFANIERVEKKRISPGTKQGLARRIEIVLSCTKLLSVFVFAFIIYGPFPFEIFSALCIVLIELNACHLTLCITITSKMYLDMCNVMVTFTLIVFDRFKYANEAFLQRPKFRFCRVHLKKFIAVHSKAFVRVMQMNFIYGPIILALLMSNYPINAFLAVEVLVQPFSTIQRLLLASYMINQLYLLFAIHSLAARYSNRISRFTGLAINCFVYLRRDFDLYSRLRMSNYISQFHIRRKFGLTYGPFGLISFIAFFKFSFLYVRFLLKFYRQS